MKKLKAKELIKNYNELWKIERAFRISKTDLRIRPIYHRLQKRIEAHICISFAAYKLYKELDRQLKEKKTDYSTERVVEVLRTIYAVVVQHPNSKKYKTKVLTRSDLQRQILEIFDLR